MDPVGIPAKIPENEEGAEMFRAEKTAPGITEGDPELPIAGDPPPEVKDPEKKLIEALGMLDDPEMVAPLGAPEGVPPAIATELSVAVSRAPIMPAMRVCL